MNLQCPDKEKIKLDDDLPIEEKIIIAENLLKKYNDYLDCGWDTVSVRYFLSGLANYIIYHREPNENSHDKDVLSKRKTLKLKKYDKNNILMSELGIVDKISLGLDDIDVE